MSSFLFFLLLFITASYCIWMGYKSVNPLGLQVFPSPRQQWKAGFSCKRGCSLYRWKGETSPPHCHRKALRPCVTPILNIIFSSYTCALFHNLFLLKTSISLLSSLVEAAANEIVKIEIHHDPSLALFAIVHSLWRCQVFKVGSKISKKRHKHNKTTSEVSVLLIWA